MFRSVLPKSKPKAVKVIEREEDGKLIIYYGHTVYVMGNYAAEIWHMCDGKHSIEDLAEFVALKYGVSIERAIEEIKDFVNRLKMKGLITFLEND
ncbi:MAG: PqqD family protein [Archaeoglobaceae archaeon]|nr:PqqD family protein [Archaeoglobaceae archaeon]